MNTLSEDPAQRTCRHCGMSISGTLYAREHDGYCCEGCFFSARAQRAFATADEEAQLALVEALAAALDAREHETGLHSKRVACHTLVLAKHFTADAQLLHQVYWGALLHDIGKIAVPDNILLKPGPLTEDEWKLMKTHSEIGYRILSANRYLKDVSELVYAHQERYDGKGYPRGLKGDEICLGARVFGVIDAYDAMRSTRPYRKSMSPEAAVRELEAGRGTHFDPVVVDVFLRHQAEIEAVGAWSAPLVSPKP